MNLAGKRVLITGGAKRIGAAIAKKFAEKGCELLVHYHRSAKEAKVLARELSATGVVVELYRANLEKEKEVQTLARMVLKSGSVDILIHNASLFSPIPFQKIKIKQWDQFMNVNLKAAFILSQSLGKSMLQRGGKIVNLADFAGQYPYRNYLPYCVSKGALLSLTRALSVELAPQVQVNSVCLGPIVPPPWFSPEAQKRIVKRLPLGRWGKVEEVANGVLFLCESDFMTGSELVLDGGDQLV